MAIVYRSRGRLKPRSRSRGSCFGVNVSYPNPKDFADVVKQDAKIMSAVRRAVPRIKRDPDGGFGMGKRDLQFDYVSYGRGFTRAEANKLVRAARTAGASSSVHSTACRVR